MSTDAIEMRIRFPMWHCKVCNALVSDPENHVYHAVINIDETTPAANPAPPGAGDGEA